jgi:putative acetyltransferase
VPGTKCSISSAQSASELEAVRALFRDYRNSLDGIECFEGFEEELSNLPGDYKQPHGILVLAWLEDRPVGCVGLRPYPHAKRACELKRLYVKDEARGLGIGRNLLRRALRHAKARRYQRLVLDTLPSMTEAHALYESFGFEKCPLTPGLSPEERIEMQLRLV